MQALHALQARTPEVLSPPGAPPLQLTSGRVEFDNVRFGYGVGDDATCKQKTQSDSFNDVRCMM